MKLSRFLGSTGSGSDQATSSTTPSAILRFQVYGLTFSLAGGASARRPGDVHFANQES